MSDIFDDSTVDTSPVRIQIPLWIWLSIPEIQAMWIQV